jgi:hypothetical protein
VVRFHLDQRQAGLTAETLRSWVRRAEVDEGKRPGLTSDERVKLKAPRRKTRELRRANEILILLVIEAVAADGLVCVTRSEFVRRLGQELDNLEGFIEQSSTTSRESGPSRGQTFIAESSQSKTIWLRRCGAIGQQ